MMRASQSHTNHRVVAVYGDSDMTMFQLPRNATLADLVESLDRRAPRPDMLPVRIEVSVGR
jgi:hypothetical protein